MFGEGPGNREEFIKAEAEIALSKKPGEKVVENKENKENKDLLDNSGLKTTFKNATEFAKNFIKANFTRAKKEKAEKS